MCAHNSTLIEDHELVNATNLNSLLTLPFDIQNEIFKRLSQKDLLNCLYALPEHRDAIGHILSKRLVNLKVIQSHTFFALLHALMPFVTKLRLCFSYSSGCRSPEIDNHRERVLKLISQCSRLKHLELSDCVLCTPGQVGSKLQFLRIDETNIDDVTLAGYVSASYETLQTLELINVSQLSGNFLDKMPSLINLKIHHHLTPGMSLSRSMQSTLLVDYLARSKTLRTLHLDEGHSDFYQNLIQQLEHMEEVCLCLPHLIGGGIRDVATTTALAKLPNMKRLNVQMCVNQLAEFFNAVLQNNRLALLVVRLRSLCGSWSLLEHCNATSLMQMSQQTDLHIVLPNQSQYIMNSKLRFVRCRIGTLVQKLATLPALHTLSILSTSPETFEYYGPTNILPHDLTAGWLVQYLPRLRHLHIELPTHDVHQLANLRELISLKLMVMRTKLWLDEDHMQDENVNRMLYDLCSLKNLVTLCVVGDHRNALCNVTCERFAQSRVRNLEVSLNQKMEHTVLLLQSAMSVRHYIDYTCDEVTWKKRNELMQSCAHITSWRLLPRHRTLLMDSKFSSGNKCQ